MEHLFVVDRDTCISQGLRAALHNDGQVAEIEFIHFQDLLEDWIELEQSGCWLLNVRCIQVDDAVRIARMISANSPKSSILAFGAPDNPQSILHLMESGVDAYVRQSTSVDEVVAAWRRMSEGQTLVCRDIAGVLMHRIAELAGYRVRSGYSGGASGPSEMLTTRQQEILELIGLGMTNAEIAERLYIEVGTVKNHVHNLLDRLDAKNRYEAVAKSSGFAI